VAPDRSRTAYVGRKRTIEWAIRADGSCPAREFFNGLRRSDQIGLAKSFERLGDDGYIRSKEHFKQIEGTDLHEFKRFQIRIIGAWRLGGRFLMAHGIDDKKQDKLKRSDIDKAYKILAENDAMERKES
jgi:hypothetical protein